MGSLFAIRPSSFPKGASHVIAKTAKRVSERVLVDEIDYLRM
jgi:hypothetical protein